MDKNNYTCSRSAMLTTGCFCGEFFATMEEWLMSGKKFKATIEYDPKENSRTHITFTEAE